MLVYISKVKIPYIFLDLNTVVRYSSLLKVIKVDNKYKSRLETEKFINLNIK